MFFKKWKLLSMSLKECIYIEKEKRATRYITDDLESSFDDSDKNRLKPNICQIFFNKGVLNS